MYKPRYTHWRRITDTARRRQGSWIDANRLYTSKMASQLCSDIRAGRRIVGLLPGEVWDAEWWRIGNENEDCEVYVRLVSSPAPLEV